MKTLIRGRDAVWSTDVWALWREKVEPFLDGRVVESANYFTPRPWRNEYDRGCPDYGFTYLWHDPRGLRGRDVGCVKWTE